jgi:hypothetical protein
LPSVIRSSRSFTRSTFDFADFFVERKASSEQVAPGYTHCRVEALDWANQELAHPYEHSLPLMASTAASTAKRLRDQVAAFVVGNCAIAS